MDATKLNPNMFLPWRAFPAPQPQTQYDAMITRAEDGKVRSLTPRGLADMLWGCAVTGRGTSRCVYTCLVSSLSLCYWLRVRPRPDYSPLPLPPPPPVVPSSLVWFSVHPFVSIAVHF